MAGLSTKALEILIRTTKMSGKDAVLFQQAVDEIDDAGVITPPLSSPGTGANSEKFGAATLADGADSVAFGNAASAPGASGTALGRSTVAGQDGIALGRDAATSGANDGQWGAVGRPVDFQSYRQSALGYASVAADTDTVTTPQAIIGVTDTTVPRTITLQTATLKAGRSITINDESSGAGTNNITIATQGSETIDGAATAVIDQDNGAVQLYSDGSNWFTSAAVAVDPFAVLTEGSVVFVDAGGGAAAEDNANLFWDDTNDRLGVRTATPDDALDVAGALRLTSNEAFVSSAGPRLYKDATTGFSIQAGTGSVADLSWFTNAGQRILDVTAGTNDLFLQPTVAGKVTVGSTLQVNAGLSAFGATPPASQPAAIADASGGATVDAEARTAINALLAVMRANGLIDT